MALNRIRRYEQLWSSQKKADANPAGLIPPGFTLMLLNHLPLEQRQTIEAQKALYDWAYREAQRKADNEFFEDWMI